MHGTAPMQPGKAVRTVSNPPRPSGQPPSSLSFDQFHDQRGMVQSQNYSQSPEETYFKHPLDNPYSPRIPQKAGQETPKFREPVSNSNVTVPTQAPYQFNSDGRYSPYLSGKGQGAPPQTSPEPAQGNSKGRFESLHTLGYENRSYPNYRFSDFSQFNWDGNSTYFIRNGALNWDSSW